MIVLANIPRFTPTSNYSLGILSHGLSQRGIAHEMIDINIDLYRRYANTELWEDFEIFGIKQIAYKDAGRIKPLISEFAKDWAKRIAEMDPEYLGMSVFTPEARNWAEIICAHVRTIAPKIKIVIGGRGISNPGTPNASFALRMKKLRLIDHFILGEAEQELADLLSGNPKTTDSMTALEYDDLDYLDPNSIPQYHYDMISSWYGIEDHQGTSNVLANTDAYPDKVINTFARMISTKGCVKRCTFCDVPLYRKGFSYKDPKVVFDQMRRLIEDKGVRGVLFMDDMINGNNKQFFGWLELLAKYLDDNKISDFTWTSQFGIKHKRTFGPDQFDLMSRTGSRLTIGFDHFSDDVLRHMEKRYTFDDIEHFVTNGVKHGMFFNLFLLVIGYPTETLRDIEILKDRLTWMGQYHDKVHAFDLGATCNITVGSRLESLPGMQVNENQGQWYWPGNPDLTPEERSRRRKEVSDLVDSLGFNNRKARTWKLRIENWANSSGT